MGRDRQPGKVSPWRALLGRAARDARGYISHTQYEFGSILRYVEDNFGLGRLSTTDARAASIGDVFNYAQSPRAFKEINSRHSIRFFERQRASVQRGDPE